MQATYLLIPFKNSLSMDKIFNISKAVENAGKEYGVNENEAKENGATEKGAKENGAREKGANENEAKENGARENGSKQPTLFGSVGLFAFLVILSIPLLSKSRSLVLSLF